MEDLVSVIIPTYNREYRILEALNSVLNQTYQNLEVIVVDDCSTDNTKEKISLVNDARLRYIKLDKNSGACVARNEGIRNANGKYLAFQDSDDIWYRDKIARQIKIMKEKGVCISFCNFREFSRKKKDLGEFPQGVLDGIIGYEQLLAKSIASTQCIVGEKACFDDIKFDSNLPRLQDWDLILELSKKYDIYHIDEVLVEMHVQDDSISTHPEKGISALKIIYEKNREKIEKCPNIERNLHIYMGNYLLAARRNPAEEYRKALKIRFSKEIFVKYVLSFCRLIIPIYKLIGRI